MKDIGNVFILGDSYSTFEGWIPEGYEIYYYRAGREETDVTRVEETWWHQVLEKTQSTLVRNSSYSGTTICNTGYDGMDYTSKSFLTRLKNLIERGYFVEHRIDTFFLFGGTNDNWADAPIGEVQYGDWSKECLYDVLPAFCCLLQCITENFPQTRILCILNSELKPEIETGYKAACQTYQVEYLQLEDIDKKCGHPTIFGMKQIAEQVMKVL